jgi:hypothetical protein
MAISFQFRVSSFKKKQVLRFGCRGDLAQDETSIGIQLFPAEQQWSERNQVAAPHHPGVGAGSFDVRERDVL